MVTSGHQTREGQDIPVQTMKIPRPFAVLIFLIMGVVVFPFYLIFQACSYLVMLFVDIYTCYIIKEKE